jgi:methionyl-tRNA formyltransferase
MTKVIFLGTPDFALPSLEKLIASQDLELLAVVTQPDKPLGRQQVLTAPPAKTLALKHGIEVLQPEKISQSPEILERLSSLKPDILISVAYGQILKTPLLKLAPRGALNLHASLLPQYKGPAPINWMIIHGEPLVGVTTMLSDEGVDTGDILLQAETPLGENETAQELSARLAVLGAELLYKTLIDLDNINPRKQAYCEPEKNLAPFMDKKLGAIDFRQEYLVYTSPNPRQKDFKVVKKNSALNIHNLVRGTYPWPGAYFIHQGKKISIIATRIEGEESKAAPGTLIASDKQDRSISVATWEGVLKILKVKPEGKSEMGAYDWLIGRKDTDLTSLLV